MIFFYFPILFYSFFFFHFCFPDTVGPPVRNERWLSHTSKNPIILRWSSVDEMEEIGGRASLVLFAPLLDVAHRLELNRCDGLSVQEGSCMDELVPPPSFFFPFLFIPFFSLLSSFSFFGERGGVRRQIVFAERFRAWNTIINMNK